LTATSAETADCDVAFLPVSPPIPSFQRMLTISLVISRFCIVLQLTGTFRRPFFDYQLRTPNIFKEQVDE
jgi:hypothetical protein